MKRIKSIENGTTIPYLQDLVGIDVQEVSHSAGVMKGSPKPILWSSILIPKVKDVVLHLDDEKQNEAIKYALTDAVSRQTIMEKLMDLEFVRTVIEECIQSRNGQASLGIVCTSTTNVINAVRAKLNGVTSSICELGLAGILIRYFKMYDMLLPDSDIYAYHSRQYKIDRDDVAYAVMEYFLVGVLNSLPNRRGISDSKTTTNVLAVEFINLHTTFVTSLAEYDSFKNSVESFLMRLRSYILGTTHRDYGDNAAIFLRNSNFLNLSQNLSLIYLSLGNVMLSKSNPVMWDIEDDRIARCIDNLTETGCYIKVDKNSFMRSFNIDVVTSVLPNDRRIVIIDKQIESKEQDRGYRVLDANPYKRYVFDKRLEFFNQFQYSVKQLPVLSHCVSVLRRLAGFDTSRLLITQGLTPFDRMALAACYADSVSVDKTTGEMVYNLSTNSLSDVQIDMLDFVGDIGLTKDPENVLFLASSRQSATNSLVSFEDTANLEKIHKYIGYDALFVDPFADVINIKIEIEGKIINLTLDVQDFLINEKVGNYALSDNREFRVKLERLLSLVEYIDTIISDEHRQQVFDRQLAMMLRPLLQSLKGYDALIRNELYKSAKGNDLLISSIYNNTITYNTIRLTSLQLLASVFGYDLSEIINRIRPFIDEIGLDDTIRESSK